MKAAVLRELLAPLEIEELSRRPLEYGQVFVKITCAGICGAQFQEIAGLKGGPRPHLLGHEGCGRVVDIGDGALGHVSIGEKVVLHWRKGDSIQSALPLYKSAKGEVGAGSVTTFSDYAVVSANRCTPVEDDVPDELCALLGCGLSTALATIENEAKLLIGERVTVIGCGGVGLCLIMAARLRGAGRILAVDRIVGKARHAVDVIGADDYSDYPNECSDVIIDTSGSGSAIEDGLRHLKQSGRFIMVGQPHHNFEVSNPTHLFSGEGKTIKATQGGGFNPSVDIPRYVRFWRRGNLRWKRLITHEVALEEINRGLDLIRNGEAGKVIVKMP